MLVKDNLLYSVRGKGGGYKLARDPKDYTILELLNLSKTACPCSLSYARGRSVRSRG